MSAGRSSSRGSHATSTLSSNLSEGSSVQEPADETFARGSSESPCRAVRLVNFPRDGHEPSACATGSDAFPPKSSGTARSGIDEAMGPWLCPQVGEVLLLAQQTVHMDPECLLILAFLGSLLVGVVWFLFVLGLCFCVCFCFGWLPTMSRCRSFLPDLMTVRAVMVRAAMEKKKSNKKIILWKSLLEEYKYPDMAVVSELLEGTKLIGETDTTGLWPAKFVPATVSEIELYDISMRERESICNKVKDTPSETDLAVWEKTLEEVEKGWLVGPFDPQQVPSHYPLSRRFGVAQGEKTRCVDDFSRSHVNACVQVTEAPKPHTVDVLASLLMQAMTVCPNAEGWCVRTLDLEDAYRQCAIATSPFAFSHIVVREPATGLPKASRC